MPDQQEKAAEPFICRIVPEKKGFLLEWFDLGNGEGHTMYYRIRGTDEIPAAADCGGSVLSAGGLEDGREYEVWIERNDGSAKSSVRLVRCGQAPGVTVNYLHPEDRLYAFSGHSLCSPSLVKLRENTYLASMDVYAANEPQNLSLIFKTEDGGSTWRYVCDLFPCFWGKLFVHRDVLYMLATTTEYGNLVIGCSCNEGETWSSPVTLFPGAGKNTHKGPHKAPVPVIESGGRLYTGVEYGSWKTGGHGAGLLSIDSESDLMAAENWRCTGFLPYNPVWPGAAEGSGGSILEGNAVVSPDGKILDILRYQMTGCKPAYGKAVVLEADARDPEKPLLFQRFMEFNGGSNSKFDLQRDPLTGTYWAIGNEIVDTAAPGARNVLSLAYSKDLDHAVIVKTLLDYRKEDMNFTGFQYVSFLFDGDDICYLCRTAFNGAANFHDANHITFHRIKNYRQYME